MMSQYAPCPKCGASGAQKVGYTWWGGVLGPSLLSHVKCPGCRMEYNGKTGGSNTTGILIYLGAGFVLALIVGIMFALARH